MIPMCCGLVALQPITKHITVTNI